MADYTYRIYAAADNTAPNFTTLSAAWSHAVSNDPTGSGTNGRVAASSTIYFKIDGFLSLSGADLYGINTTTNSNARIIIESYSNAWNSTARAIRHYTTYDGIDFGGSANMNLGIFSNRQANVLVRNLIITNGTSGYGPIEIMSPVDHSGDCGIENCVLYNSATSAPRGVRLSAGFIRNSLVIINGTTTRGELVESASYTTANPIDHCTLISLASTSPSGATLINNQNDPNPQMRGCYVAGVTTWSTYTGGGNISGSDNATDAASGWTGPTNTLYSMALSTTNFEAVGTATTSDFRVKSSSSMVGYATKLSAPLDVDIFGATRADPTTVGAFEAGGSTSIAPQLVTGRTSQLVAFGASLSRGV